MDGGWLRVEGGGLRIWFAGGRGASRAVSGVAAHREGKKLSVIGYPLPVISGLEEDFAQCLCVSVREKDFVIHPNGLAQLPQKLNVLS